MSKAQLCSFCDEDEGLVLLAHLSEATKELGVVGICKKCITAAMESVCGAEEQTDNAHPLTKESICRDEIAKMPLLDFLREYNGSPAVSNLTVGNVIALVLMDSATNLMQLVEKQEQEKSEKRQDSKATDSAGEKTDESEKILWRMKFLSGRIIEIYGFTRLQRCAVFYQDAPFQISPDNCIWVSWKNFQGTFAVCRQAGLPTTPLDVFHRAVEMDRSIEADAPALPKPSPGHMLIDEPFVAKPEPADASTGAKTTRVSLRARLVAPEVAKLVPKEICEMFKVFPVEISCGRDKLILAMADVSNQAAIRCVTAGTEFIVEPISATEEEILAAIKYYLG